LRLDLRQRSVLVDIRSGIRVHEAQSFFAGAARRRRHGAATAAATAMPQFGEYGDTGGLGA